MELWNFSIHFASHENICKIEERQSLGMYVFAGKKCATGKSLKTYSTQEQKVLKVDAMAIFRVKSFCHASCQICKFFEAMVFENLMT